METFGITRKVDEVGRIVIPRELMNMLKIYKGDIIEISANDKEITLKKHIKKDNVYINLNKLVDFIVRERCVGCSTYKQKNKESLEICRKKCKKELLHLIERECLL